jgi:putative addiction module component (TIGR02574 family)
MNIQQLSTSEKILLAEELWESVRADATQEPLQSEHTEILNKRLQALEMDGDIGDSWENVFQRVVANGQNT